MTAVYNPKFSDFLKAFEAVSENGTKVFLKVSPGIFDPFIVSHVQGMAYWREYAVFTYNAKSHSEGKLIVSNRSKNRFCYSMNVAVPHRNHPGGIQFMGDILAVAVEDSTANVSRIVFYDFSGVNDDTEPKMLESPKIIRSTERAGGVGITNFTNSDGEEVYWLAVNDNGRIDLYRSNFKTINDPALKFTFIKRFNISHDASEICLVTDKSNKSYIVGFTSVSQGSSYADWGYVYDLDGKLILKRHFITDNALLSGLFGSHFRWGAGLQILVHPDKDPTLLLYCSERNFENDSTGVMNNFYTV